MSQIISCKKEMKGTGDNGKDTKEEDKEKFADYVIDQSVHGGGKIKIFTE
jgi:hypothetical protein